MSDPNKMSRDQLVAFLTNKSGGTIDTTSIDLAEMISIATCLIDSEVETNHYTGASAPPLSKLSEGVDEETAKAIAKAMEDDDYNSTPRRSASASASFGASSRPVAHDTFSDSIDAETAKAIAAAMEDNSFSPPVKHHTAKSASSGEKIDEETAKAIALAMEDNDYSSRTARTDNKGAAKQKKERGGRDATSGSKSTSRKGTPPPGSTSRQGTPPPGNRSRQGTPPPGNRSRQGTPPPGESEQKWQTELIDEFVEACGGCDRKVAKHMLGACSFEMDRAMIMYMDQPPPAPASRVMVSKAAAAELRGLINPNMEGMMADGHAFPSMPHPGMPGFNEFMTRGMGMDIGDDESDDNNAADQYDEQGVRRPDKVRHQRLQSPRHTNSDYEDAAARADASDVTWYFEPPAHLSFVGSLLQARELAKSEGKFLLCNIQAHGVFASSILNRDTWSDETVQEILRTNFVFWQRGITSPDGQKYAQMYRLVPVKDESDIYPHIGIIDPRTGLIMKSLVGYREPTDLMEIMINFTDKHGNKLKKAENGKKEGGTTAAAGATEVAASAKMVAKESGGGEEGSGGTISGANKEEEEMARVIAESAKAFSEQQEAETREMSEAKATIAAVINYGPPPAEPPAGGDSCKVQLKFVDSGGSEVRRFLKSDRVIALFAWAQALLEAKAEGGGAARFEMSTAYPAKTLDPDGGTLQDEKLNGAQVVLRLL